MPCKCEDENTKLHPWFSICVQQVVRATDLEKVMTTWSPLKAKQVLLNKLEGVSKATRICMSQSIHVNPHTTAVSNNALATWLMTTWPGADPSNPCVKK